MMREGFEAVEVIVRFPLTLPADAGVNVTVKVALCPAVNVTGALTPVRLYPVPLIPTWEIVTLEPPALVTVSDKDCLLPTITLPKLRLVGFDPTAPGATPVPDTPNVIEGFEASALIVTVPVALPLACGSKATVNVVLWEALSVNGVVIPLS